MWSVLLSYSQVVALCSPAIYTVETDTDVLAVISDCEEVVQRVPFSTGDDTNDVSFDDGLMNPADEVLPEVMTEKSPDKFCSL